MDRGPVGALTGATAPTARRRAARGVARVAADPIPVKAEVPCAPVTGAAWVGFAERDGATQLVELYQQAPLKVLRPNAPDDVAPLAVLANISGGVVGGDRLTVDIAIGIGARAVVTSQAAEKVYRSAGPEARIENHLSIGAVAWGEWLPQETILFDACRFRRRMQLDVAAGGRGLAGEILVFGRLARGERLRRGLVHDAWEVRRDGRLVWSDALHLEGNIEATLDEPACFGGARACATLLYVGDDAASHLELVRAAIEPVGAATRLGSVIVARLLAAEPHHLRHVFGAAWASLRAAIAALPPVLPSTWRI